MREDDRKLDNCVKCTDCNAACPVTKVFPSFPGPKTLGPDLERVRKEGIECNTEWLEYCLGCNRCEIACPNQVNVSELIARAKAKQPKSGAKGLRDHFLARPDLLGKICSVIPGATNLLLASKPNRWLMSKTMHITGERAFPKYRSKATRVSRKADSQKRAIFFPGCFIGYNVPELSQAVVDLLEFYGCSVEIVSSACCGVPALANGDAPEVLDDVRRNVARLLPAVKDGTPIITACTSCGHMFKAEYPRLMANDGAMGEAAAQIAQNSYDLGEFLLAQEKPAFALRPVEMKLAYHAPCHLKGQGIGRPWLDLLREIPGLQIDEIAAECCGMSGTYGFKQEKYQISMDIGKELFDGIKAYRPDFAVSECGTCRMQIEHGTAVKTFHPAEILHRACGLSA
jgi:glycerol-3-phosphate dehydrogenase subunit C